MAPRAGRRRRVLFSLLGTLLALVVVWAVWASAVIQTPRVDQPSTVDAVLVLGGVGGPQRSEVALDMAADGLTHTIVFSIPVGGEDYLARRTCQSPPAGVEVICFDPNPSTTRGEARKLEQLASERGWSRVAVVTSAYHISRSRMIVERCYSGTLLMLKSHESVSPLTWAYQWIYQTAGYVKAEILRGC